jgi:hypothetical protein
MGFSQSLKFHRPAGPLFPKAFSPFLPILGRGLNVDSAWSVF